MSRHLWLPSSLTCWCLQCLYMYNLDKDELICKSCPVYGTEPGESVWPHLPMQICLCIASIGGRVYTHASREILTQMSMQVCLEMRRAML